MIVRKLTDLIGTEREICGETWTSRRLLLKGDGMGFSLHDTIIHAGSTTKMHYQHHLEAVYCIQGRGRIRDLTNHSVFEVEVGTMYALSGNEQHELIADEEMRMVCVFNPPVVGTETHDTTGAYPLLD